VDLDAVISRAELEAIARSYKHTAGFDPEILNTRPSLGVGPHRADGHRPAARPAHMLAAALNCNIDVGHHREDQQDRKPDACLRPKFCDAQSPVDRRRQNQSKGSG
jgi:hypothetical protein